MNLADADAIDRALSLLAAMLEARDAEPTQVVVIGGAALSVLGIRVRPTKDVDVLGLAESGEDNTRVLVKYLSLPEPLASAAAAVADLLGLDPDWLNIGPARLLDWGLPEGFADRLSIRSYGARLNVLLPAREDLICLKVYATADMGPGRHSEDLRAMSPTCQELLDGVRWARTHDASDEFGSMLLALLQHFGCDSDEEVLPCGS